MTKNNGFKTFIMRQLMFVLMLIPFLSMSQSGMQEITQALNTGNADVLANYFDESLELSILGEEGIFNKATAVQKVRRFVAQNKISSFAEVHQGASRSSDSQYVIGNLATSGGTFRVYLYLTNVKGRFVIQEFRFDKE